MTELQPEDVAELAQAAAAAQMNLAGPEKAAHIVVEVAVELAVYWDAGELAEQYDELAAAEQEWHEELDLVMLIAHEKQGGESGVVADGEIDSDLEGDAELAFAWGVPADEAEVAYMTDGLSLHERVDAGQLHLGAG